jgi:hypothetical protein
MNEPVGVRVFPDAFLADATYLNAANECGLRLVVNAG